MLTDQMNINVHFVGLISLNAKIQNASIRNCCVMVSLIVKEAKMSLIVQEVGILRYTLVLRGCK